MNLNFNIVKKPEDKDDNEEVEEVETLTDDLEEEAVDIKPVKDDDDDDDDMPSYDPKKKMFKFMGIIVFVMIILLIILFLISSCSNKGKSANYSYSEIESVLTKAAKSYFKDHPEYLPKDEGDLVEVEASTLAAEGKMNELSEYTDKACTAKVQVANEGKDYLYTPNLNCGDSYSTVPLYSKVLDNNEPVTTGYGLYANNGGYSFRGEEVNNYVELDKSLWRIVKITADNNVVLINADGLDYSEAWDDRYNEKSGFQTGINNYSASRVKELLDKVYSGDTKYDEYLVLSKKDKTRIVSYNLCVGKRKINSEGKNNAEECNQLLRDQKLGLLTLSDYMYASIDPNCKSASTSSCQNYNYLVIKDEWWLMTANAADTATAYMINRNGVIKAEEAYGYATIRPVIYLNENVLFKSGKGTLKKPYKVK